MSEIPSLFEELTAEIKRLKECAVSQAQTKGLKTVRIEVLPGEEMALCVTYPHRNDEEEKEMAVDMAHLVGGVITEGLNQALTAENAALKAKLHEVRVSRCALDCRYTMGGVSDLSGSHCPADDPCDRCVAERDNAALTETGFPCVHEGALRWYDPVLVLTWWLERFGTVAKAKTVREKRPFGLRQRGKGGAWNYRFAIGKVVFSGTTKTANLEEALVIAETVHNKKARRHLTFGVVEVERANSDVWSARQRERFLDAYGGRCDLCHETDRIVLTLDHVQGDGAAERVKHGKGPGCHWKMAADNYDPQRFRILCHNCQFREKTRLKLFRYQKKKVA